MKRSKLFRRVPVALACWGMLLSASALAGGVATPAKTSTIPADGSIDVALGDGGTLVGQLLTPQAAARPHVRITLRQGGRQAASTVTDGSGTFRLAGLRGGTYQLVAGDAAVVCRLWAPHTAPPAAQPVALLVWDGRQVLGQYGHVPALKTWLANPWVVAAIVATAVAIPVGIHNHNLDRAPASP